MTDATDATDVTAGSATVRDFLLPDLGEGLTEGEVAAWLVEVGDTVAVDDPVAEIETAKALVEVPTPFAGVVVARHAEVGEELEVGQPLVSIETDPDAEPPGPSDEGGPTDREAGATPDDVAESASGSVLVGYGTGASSPRRRRRGGQARPRTQGSASGPPVRPLAKPPVRKMAQDLGVDLAEVRPSGEGGIITRDDVRAAAQDAGPAPTEERAPSPEGRRIPLRGVRRTIAERMTRSRQEIPEATTWVDCDATALMAVRDELNDARSDVRVSPLALVLRCCVTALDRYPELNASLDVEAQEIVLHDAVHLGIAAQTDRGLVVPVIADAHRKTTLEIAADLNRVVQLAREGSLSPDQLSGSTFSVSNYGSFGVDGGAPIINHPNAAILGIGRIAPRPWVHDGEIAVRQVVQLSIAFDHRVCDGAEAAGFLRFVADCVERPALLLAHV